MTDSCQLCQQGLTHHTSEHELRLALGEQLFRPLGVPVRLGRMLGRLRRHKYGRDVTSP